MLIHQLFARNAALISLIVLALVMAGPAAAQGNSMSSPVVKDAQAALASEKVDSVLKWVSEADEVAIRDAFQMTLAIRAESAVAKTIADRYFFETLVKTHRATLGEGFTGLKPAENVEPAIAAADRALEFDKGDQLADEIATAVREGIQERFADAYGKRQVAEQSVEQGREYVKAYLELTHFVVGVDHLVIPPSPENVKSRVQPTTATACCEVMPPRSLSGRSLL